MSRHNPVKGEVTLPLSDGRQLTLVLGMGALVEAEALYRKPLRQVLADAAAGFVGATAALLVGACSRHHPDLTRDDALEILRTDGDAAAIALADATAAAFPAPDKGAEGNAPAPKPTGKRSGRNGAKQG